MALPSPSSRRTHLKGRLECLLVRLAIEFPLSRLLSPSQPSTGKAHAEPLPVTRLPRCRVHFEGAGAAGAGATATASAGATATKRVPPTLPAPGSPLLPHRWSHSHLTRHCREPAQVACRSGELLCVVCSSLAQLRGRGGQTE